MHRIDNVCAGERMRQPYSFLIGKIKQEQTRTCQTLVKKKTTKRKIVVFNIVIMQGVYKNHKLITITRSKIANGTIKIRKCDIQKKSQNVPELFWSDNIRKYNFVAISVCCHCNWSVCDRKSPVQLYCFFLLIPITILKFSINMQWRLFWIRFRYDYWHISQKPAKNLNDFTTYNHPESKISLTLLTYNTPLAKPKCNQTLETT